MIRISGETETLLKARAAESGRTPDEVLRAALLRSGQPMPWRSSARPKPATRTREELIAAMEEIAARSAARPVVDPRSPEEIVGYDDFGLPR
jgi:antitoxin VapB